MNNYSVVPWVNSEEWNKVMELIYSETPNEEEALQYLLIWKARCPSLPSGIESTLILLQVRIQELNSQDNVENDYVFRLAYSSAVMRFINHMLDVNITKTQTIYKAAKDIGIPDWIVDLRHDTAHSNNLPSLSLLKDAAEFGLNWLKSNYWEKHKILIKNYKSGKQEADAQEENRILTLVNFCVSLSICSNSECKIKTLANISDTDMRDSIIADARELLGDDFEFTNLTQVTISTLIEKMNYHGKALLKSKNARKYFIKALLGADSLILSLDTLNYFGMHFDKNRLRLKKKYLHCFEILIRFLHLNDFILDFIMGLVKITVTNESNEQQATLAALWLSEIISAFRRKEYILEKMEKASNKVIKKYKELQAIYRHWFPNSKNGIIFDLNKPTPVELQNIHFIQPIIATYNPYLNYFVDDLLHLVQPHLPDMVIKNVCDLVKLISVPIKNPSTSSKIYTIDDIMSHDDPIDLTESIQSEMESFESSRSAENNIGDGIWKICTDDFEWSTCPIGQLPLSRNMKPVEEMEL